MASLQPYALATLAELKEIIPVSGSGRDDALRQAINRASRWLEEHAGRRFVFRAPTVDADAIIAAVVSGAQTIAGSPPSPGGTLVVTVPSTITAGTLVVTGTVAGVAGVTETFDLSLGIPTLYGVKFFTTVASATVSGLTGTGTPTVGYSLGYVDYFTPRRGSPHLRLLDYPVRQVLAVHEDSTRAYDAATELEEDEDFLVTGAARGCPRGVLERTSASDSGPAAWLCSFRGVRVIHSAGYFTVANVPTSLKGLAVRLAKFMYDEEQESTLDTQQESDSMGSRTRVGRSTFLKAIREEAEEFVNHAWPGDALRDWDQEAA